MPELPEVETIKNELLPEISGRRIVRVEIKDDKPIRKSSPKEFLKYLVGKEIKGLDRRGKYLIFHLSKGVLIIHLRMTGVLLLNSQENERFARIVFKLDDGNTIVFSDRRRLGVMWVAENEEEVSIKLGTEPLSKEFTVEAFKQRLQSRKAPIKAVLLDQSFIAGIGNMYADEALFQARIHPLKKANDLSLVKIRKLHRAIITILKAAIKNKGASIDTYRSPDGRQGTAHNEFKVAHRKNCVCPECGGLIDRIMIRNRGSYFCPACQKLS